MTQSIDPNDLSLWQNFRDANSTLISSRAKLVQNAKNLVSLVELGFSNRDFIEVLQLIPALPINERIIFFDRLLEGASYQTGLYEKFQEAIMTIPVEWLIQNIPTYAEKILDGEDKFEEYAVLMVFFKKIDTALSEWLAQKAIQHKDNDIQTIGHDELKRLKQER